MRIVYLLVSMIVLVLFSFPVEAAKTRTCNGSYELTVTSVNGVPPQKKKKWNMGDFRGKGTHRSANKARVNAKGALKSCYSQHWDTRWERTKPPICNAEKDSMRDGGKGWVEQYGIIDLKTAIEKTVCCSDYGENNSEIIVAVHGTSSGDNGCFSDPKASAFKKYGNTRFMVAPEYKMTCSELRKKVCN